MSVKRERERERERWERERDEREIDRFDFFVLFVVSMLA